MMRSIKTKIYIVLSLLGILFFSYSAYATHMRGGEITWRCVGTNTYLIQLVVYEDCNTYVIGNSPLSINCGLSGSLIQLIPITSWPSPIDITPLCDSSCSRCQSGFCSFPIGVKKFVVNTIVNLNPNTTCCDVSINWSQAARVLSYGSLSPDLWIESDMNICQNLADNSPQFSTEPFSIICLNQDFEWNFGVKDPDTNAQGKPLDSLVYEMTPANAGIYPITYPYGLSYSAPIHFYGNLPNLALPMGFHLDPLTGNVQFRPVLSENAIFAIKVKEYRAGVLIGSVSRDFNVDVIVCGTNHTPKINVANNKFYKEVCVGDTLKFDFPTSDQDSTDSLVIIPDSQLQKGSWTINTSQAKRPVATFTWVTTAQDYRPQPYAFICTVKDKACPIPGIIRKTLIVKIKKKITVTDTITNLGCANFKLAAYPLIGSGIEYLWKGKGGISSTHQSFHVQLNKPGLYPITLKITANDACMVTYHDTIRNESSLYAELRPDTSICFGEEITLTAGHQFGIEPLHYGWSTSASDTLQSNTITVTKDSVISVKITDADGCTSKDSIKLIIKKLPIADAGKDTIMCAGDSIHLTASGGIKYLWFSGNTSQDVIVKPNITQYYSVSVTDSVNCSSPDSVQVTVNQLPTVYAGQNDTLCTSEHYYKLKGTPSSTLAYWTGWDVKGDTFDLSNSRGGIYQFSYHFTDSNGCANSDTVQILVYLNPKPFAGIYSNACINSAPISLIGSPPDGNWHGSFINNNSFYPSQAGPGLHQIVYEAYNHICNGFDTTYIRIMNLPDTSLIRHGSKLTATAGMLQYAWYRNDTILIGADSSSYLPDIAGHYYVVLTDTSGCSDTSSSYYIDFLGIPEPLSNAQINIYPNPANDEINIHFTKLSGTNLIYSIRSIDGKEILTKNISITGLSTETINIRTLLKGMYFIELLFDNQIKYFIFIKN